MGTENDRVIIFNMSEIAARKIDGKKIDIPSFQRSLVWKPEQMELLWDSILRCFPIGSFTLSESDTSNNTDEKILYLMDGQQRFNTIGLGFDKSVWDQSPGESIELNSVLWLDILNGNTNKGTRKYWIKATTKYHPWG